MTEQSKPMPCMDKLAFDTQVAARAAVLVAEMQHGAKLTTYVCQYCQLWHLATKQPS